jgi:prolyl 4-hydroxylase
LSDAPLIWGLHAAFLTLHVNKSWPLEVYGHDGRAYNVSMEPGDMVLYESHSVIHGRPFPLKGRFFANIFIHFEPVYEEESVDIPPYILEGSVEAEAWRRRSPSRSSTVNSDGATRAHGYAATNNLEQLKGLAEKDPDILQKEDTNGWQPLHEAVRAGHLSVVEYLLENNVYVNHRTNHGGGSTPLGLAIEHLYSDHPVVELLERYGAEL